MLHRTLRALLLLALCCALPFPAFAGAAELSFSLPEGDETIVRMELDDPAPVTLVRVRMKPLTGQTDGVLRETCTVQGLRPGETRLYVLTGSGRTDSEMRVYHITVDGALNVAIEEERILSFFRFTYGGYLPGVRYEVFRLEDTFYLCRGDGPAKRLDEFAYAALTELIGRYDLLSWDGFSGNNPHLLDGEGFSLEIRFTDGTAVAASGENAFPAGWREARDSVVTLLDTAFGEEAPKPAGVYQYEGVTLTLTPDGDFERTAAGQAAPASGEWEITGSRLCLYEDGASYNRYEFIAIGDTLVFLLPRSDPFPGVSVPDGAVFLRRETEEEDQVR